MFKIPANAFQQITTNTTATYYFFGAKSHSSTTDYPVVSSLLECSLWNRTLIVTNVGKLTQTSDKVFRTHDKFCHDYCWLSTTKHTTLNAISTRFTLLYNLYNHKLIAPF